MAAMSTWRQALQLDVPTEKSVLLRKELAKAAEVAPPNTALLLSGRIDSSALAVLNPNIPVYTAGLEGAPDLKYARKIAETSGISKENVVQIVWTPGEAIMALKETIRFMQSYDLALLNDMVIYACMKKAKENGIRVIRTGDPADELFEEEGTNVNRKLRILRLQSERIAGKLGLNIDYPYKASGVIDVARTLRLEDNARELDRIIPADFYYYYQRGRGATEERNEWTKLTLRRAMYGLLPNDVVYRMKAPIQYGSWAYKLTQTLTANSDEIAKLEHRGIRLWGTLDKGTHARFRMIYDSVGLTPPKITDPNKQIPCTWCGGAIERNISFCYTCGGAW